MSTAEETTRRTVLARSVRLFGGASCRKPGELSKADLRDMLREAVENTSRMNEEAKQDQ